MTDPTPAHRRPRHLATGACVCATSGRSCTPPAAPRAIRAPAPSGPSVAQQMTELAELHSHGVITDAEYEQKRRELLDRL